MILHIIFSKLSGIKAVDDDVEVLLFNRLIARVILIWWLPQPLDLVVDLVYDSHWIKIFIVSFLKDFFHFVGSEIEVHHGMLNAGNLLVNRQVPWK